MNTKTTEELLDIVRSESPKTDDYIEYNVALSEISHRVKKMKSALKPILKCRFEKSKFTGNYIMTHGNAFDAIMEAQNIMKCV